MKFKAYTIPEYKMDLNSCIFFLSITRPVYNLPGYIKFLEYQEVEFSKRKYILVNGDLMRVNSKSSFFFLYIYLD